MYKRQLTHSVVMLLIDNGIQQIAEIKLNVLVTLMKLSYPTYINSFYTVLKQLYIVVCLICAESISIYKVLHIKILYLFKSCQKFDSQLAFPDTLECFLYLSCNVTFQVISFFNENIIITIKFCVSLVKVIIGLARYCCFSGVKPVSYTHLDVYKRQLYENK